MAVDKHDEGMMAKLGTEIVGIMVDVLIPDGEVEVRTEYGGGTLWPGHESVEVLKVYPPSVTGLPPVDFYISDESAAWIRQVIASEKEEE